MNITVKANEQNQVELTVEFEQDLLESHKKRAARKIARQSKIPGFRPGKAPYNVIVRQFGEEVIIDEALESLLNEKYPDILKEATVEPYGPGSLIEITSKEPPIFQLLVPLTPVVELSEYRSIRKDYQFESASDKEVNQVLMNLQVQNAVTEPVTDRVVESGDIVQLSMTQTLLNPPEDQEPVISKDATQSIYVNEEFDHEDVVPYQGFMQELVGMNIGDEKTTTHTFNEVDETDDLFEKEVEFSFTVKAISKADIPPLNDEFAQMVNPEYQTLDALKDSIREQVEGFRTSQFENRYVTDVFDEIVENSTVHYPPELFHDEGHAYLHQLMEQVSREGMEWEAYLKANDTTEHQLIEESREDIELRIKRALVLEEVARVEELRVDPDELQSKVVETMMQGGFMNYLQQLPKKQADDISRRITMDSANQLLNDKLMRRIINIASGKQEEIEKNMLGENTITEEDIMEDIQSAEGESQEETE